MSLLKPTPEQEGSKNHYGQMSLKELEEMKSDFKAEMANLFSQLHPEGRKPTKREQARIRAFSKATKELYNKVKQEIEKRFQAIVLDESSLPTISECSNQKLLEMKAKRDDEISCYGDCKFRLTPSQRAERKLALDANREYFQQVEAEIKKRKQQGRFWDDIEFYPY